MTTEPTIAAATPATMTAVVGRRYGLPDVLALERIPTPEAEGRRGTRGGRRDVAQRARLALSHRNALLPEARGRSSTPEADHPGCRRRRDRRGDRAQG